MKRQVYILKDFNGGNTSSITEENLYLLVNDIEDCVNVVSTSDLINDGDGISPFVTNNDLQLELILKADLIGGIIPSYQLPAYIDDVIEGLYVNSTTFTVGGVSQTLLTGVIYLSTNNNRQYRYSGSVLIQITNGLIGSTADVPEGTNLYFTGARVLSAVLSGLSTVTGGAIISTDTVLQAFGKIQNQITNLATLFAPKKSFIVANSTYALTSQLPLQKMSDLTLSVLANSLYKFQVSFSLTDLASAGSTFSFGILGTATITDIFAVAVALKNTGALNSQSVNIETTAATIISASTTVTTGRATITGHFRTSGAGSFIPGFGMSVAAASNVTKYSLFVERIAANTDTHSNDVI